MCLDFSRFHRTSTFVTATRLLGRMPIALALAMLIQEMELEEQARKELKRIHVVKIICFANSQVNPFGI